MATRGPCRYACNLRSCRNTPADPLQYGQTCCICSMSTTSWQPPYSSRRPMSWWIWVAMMVCHAALLCLFQQGFCLLLAHGDKAHMLTCSRARPSLCTSNAGDQHLHRHAAQCARCASFLRQHVVRRQSFVDQMGAKQRAAVGRVLLACCRDAGCRGIGFEVNSAAVEKARAQARTGVQRS